MKTVRSWLIVLGAAVALAALTLTLALLPAVQRRVLLWIAAGRPGLTLDVDRVAIRPGAAEIRGLRLQTAGVQVSVAEASFDIAWWQAVVHRRLILRSARVAGMKVDLTRCGGPAGERAGGAPLQQDQPGPADINPQPDTKRNAALPAPRAQPAFVGVFDHLDLPWGAVLDVCEVDADIVFPRAAGRLPGGARLKLTGGHLGPGRDAEFVFDATIRNPDPGAPVDEVAARGTLTATVDSRSAIERVGIHLDAVARGPLVPAAARLQAEVVLARTAAGETFSLALNSLEAGVVSRLLNLDGDYVAGSSTLTGSWRVQANHRQVAPFAVGFAVPEFSISGEGRFEVSSAAKNLQLAGRLTGNAGRLEAIDSRLGELNGLGATAAFDLRYDHGQLRITDLSAKISAGKPVLSVQAAQAFAVNLATGDIVPSGAQRELLRISLEGVPITWIRSFFPGFELSGDVIKGELVAALHGADRVWLRTSSPLRVHGFSVNRGSRVVLSTSDLSLDAEVEHSRDGTRVRLTDLNVVTATGDRLDARGELSVRPDQTVSVQASFDASLPALVREYVPAGPLIAHGSIALSRSGDVIEVGRLETHLAAADGRPLADISSPEGFRIDPRRRQITTLAGTSGEVLRMKYGRVPLDLLKPWPGLVELKGELTGGEFALRAEGDKLWVAGATPLRLENVSAMGGGMTLLKDLEVETGSSFEYSPQGATARLAGLRGKKKNGDVLLTAEVSVAVEPDFTNARFHGTTSFDLSVPALAGQPLMAGVELPRQGRLTGDVKFSFDRNLLGEGRLTLNGLVSPTTGEPLPVANLSFRAGLDDTGDIAVQAPILVDRAGERSDLTLAATLRSAGASRTIDGRITGEHVAVDDVLLLVRAFSSTNGAQPSAPGVPGWKGLTGQVQLDVRSIGFGRFPEVLDLKGRAVIEPRRLALENVTARLATEDGRLQLDGEIRCGADDPQPYTSRFDLEVKALDIGPVFKAMNRDKPPTVEGLFDIRAQADGTGRTFGELIGRTQGDLVLQSRKGISRLLERPPPATRKSTGIVSGVANTAVRLIDNIGEKVGKMVSYTDSTEEIAGMLGEVQFDQLSVRVSCDRSADLRLSEFSLVSPVLRLQGEGVITGDADKPLFSRPLKLTLSLGVMGTVEKAMTEAKAPMLSASRDDLGYLKSTEAFDVVGTLDRPDPGQLYTMVARSMIGKLLH